MKPTFALERATSPKPSAAHLIAIVPVPIPEVRCHPAANILPMLSAIQLEELAADIEKNGLIEAIVMHEGAILDGRNRWAACLLRGIEPRTVEWNGEGGTPEAFVLAKNIARRHLTPTQKAAAAVQFVKLFQAQARARQLAGRAAPAPPVRPANLGDNSSPGPTEHRSLFRPPPPVCGDCRGHLECERAPGHDGPHVAMDRADRVEWPQRPKRNEGGRAVVQAAKAAGAGVQATKGLERVRREAPEVFNLVQEGKIPTVEDAKRVAALPPPARAEAVRDIARGKAPKVERPAPARQIEPHYLHTPTPEERRAVRRVVQALAGLPPHLSFRTVAVTRPTEGGRIVVLCSIDPEPGR